MAFGKKETAVPVQNVSTEQQVPTKTTTQTPTTSPQTGSSKKTYSTKDFSLQYIDGASLNPSVNPKGCYEITSGSNLERICYIYQMSAAFDPGFSGQNTSLGNQTFGSNTFEVYQTPEGGKIYVLGKNNSAVQVSTIQGDVILTDLASIQIKNSQVVR